MVLGKEGDIQDGGRGRYGNPRYYPGITDLCAPIPLPRRSGVPGKVPGARGANPVLEIMLVERLMSGCTRFTVGAGGRFLKLPKSGVGGKICLK